MYRLITIILVLLLLCGCGKEPIPPDPGNDLDVTSGPVDPPDMGGEEIFMLDGPGMVMSVLCGEIIRVTEEGITILTDEDFREYVPHETVFIPTADLELEFTPEEGMQVFVQYSGDYEADGDITILVNPYNLYEASEIE